jgi:hypothetical protein
MRRAVGMVIAAAAAAAMVAIGGAPAGATIAPEDRGEVRKPGPLRVVLVGDSLTVNYQDEAVAMLAKRGYQVIPVGIGGLSLLDRTICSATWAREVRKMADPDIVVFESSGNYGNVPQLGMCTPRREYGSDGWLRRWRGAAMNNQRQFTRRGARMLWVEVPAVNYSPKREIIQPINAIYREVGETVDAWTAFGGEKFDPSLRSDAQHLNQRGSDLMAELVAKEVMNPEAAD